MALATTTGALRLPALLLGGALALVALASPAGAGEAEGAAASAALIERIAAAHRSVASIQGRATMRTHHRDEPASEARVKQVQFALLFPDHYRLVFNDPGDDEGRLIYLSDGVRCEQREYQFKDEAPISKVAPVGADEAEITRLLACFRLDMAALSADFTVTAVGTQAGPRVTLAPRHAPLTEQLEQITVALDAALAITRFSWADPQGNIREVTIDHADYDQPIPPATFQVTAAAAPGPGR
jgi:hypothetical protein